MAHEGSGDLASDVQSFWITNQVYFRDARYELVEKLMTMPDIASIDEERVHALPTMSHDSVSNTTRHLAEDEDAQWGVRKVQAPQVWAKGFTGQGVTVGLIDTGVLASHEVLAGSYRKSFGWYDATAQRETPYDDVNHGTHIAGSLVGAKGYGVAPGATLIACRACSRDGCADSWLLACSQFMLCPTNPAQTISDCSKAPHIINNSWGSTGVWRGYDDAIAAWRQAGIIPVFSNGNTGSKGCGTAESPGDNPNVISVGYTNQYDALDPGSSEGPASNGLMKPDITAPGGPIRSASATAPNAYRVESGSSISTPHVSGVIALLLSSSKSPLQYDQVYQRITQTADQNSLFPVGVSCGTTPDGTFPNNMYGHGRVNALSVVLGTRAGSGQCNELPQALCESTFFCTWSGVAQNCQRWW